VQKDIIARFVNLFASFKPSRFSVVLSSYGLSRLYEYLDHKSADSVTLIGIDSSHAELAIAANKKLLFSRYFNLDITKSDWQNSFIDEFNKSRDVYRKEIPGEMPDKVIILGGGKTTEEAAEALREKVGLSAQTLPYYQALTCEYSADKIPSDGYSFAGIAGLGAGDIEESLYLLPREIKEKNRILAQRKERLHMILLLAALIAVWILALTRNLDNKSRYLGLLQAEMSKIAQQAQPLEAMDKKIRMLESRSAKEALNLVLLPELYKTVPSQVYLNNLACEEESKITLRGYAPELNSVLAFVSKLESSAVLRDFDVKIKYATKRKTSKGEFIDFEISGSKLK
jgi:Tfp pilus assembly protein PilN